MSANSVCLLVSLASLLLHLHHLLHNLLLLYKECPDNPANHAKDVGHMLDNEAMHKKSSLLCQHVYLSRTTLWSRQPPYTLCTVLFFFDRCLLLSLAGLTCFNCNHGTATQCCAPSFTEALNSQLCPQAGLLLHYMGV